MKDVKQHGEALNQLYREAETELKKIPGVVGVGFGYKERDGRLTKELSLRVYVKKKKTLDKVTDVEKIPAKYKGMQTDVLNTFDDVEINCEDITHHDSVVGGITITTDSLFAKGGTLGAIITLNDVNSKDNIGILSNRHVMSTALNTPVYHPFFTNPSNINIPLSISKGVIARMHNVGTQSNFDYKYPGETDTRPYYLDCATAKVTTSHCSCCPTNCGTKYNAELKGEIEVTGLKRIQPSDLVDGTPFVVKKIGRRTGTTKGHIVDINVTYPSSGNNQKHGTILITPFEDNCEDLRKFADHGDSGSVILTEQNEVIGLLYSTPDAPAGNPYFGHGIASPIHPVLSFLNCTIIASSGANDDQRREKINTDLAHNNKLKKLEQDFVSQGVEHEKMYSDLENHRAEAVQLVNNERPVTLAWHRNQGPAFVAHFIKNFRDPAHSVPVTIKGITLPHLLEAMRNIMPEYSSPSLKKAIDEYGDLLIRSAAECSGIHHFLANISKSEHQAPIDHGRND